MTTIVTRAGKGSALTHNEVDSNFINLNNAKYESGNNATFGTIGATTGSFTSLSDSGNLTFTGTGNRITGDFSNGTALNRVSFQSSTTNGATVVQLLPNGTGTQSNYLLYNSNTPDTNFSALNMFITATESTFRSIAAGTGTLLPMTFHTGLSERMRIDTSGNVGIGTTSTGGYKVSFKNGAKSQFFTTDSSASYYYTDGNYYFGATGADNVVAVTNNTERMRIDASGNVGIGTSSPSAAKLVVSSVSGKLSYLDQPLGTWGTVANFNAYRYIETNSVATDGNFRAFHVGAGGVSIGYSSTPVYGSGDAMYVNGNVGIGTSSPVAPLNVASSTTLSAGNPSILLQGSSNTERMQIRSSFAGGGQAVALLLGSNGTAASPTAITNQQSLGYYQLGGYDGSLWQRAAWITGNAEENWTTTNRGSSLIFATTPIGSISIAERMRIDASGNVGIGTSSPSPFRLNVQGGRTYLSANNEPYALAIAYNASTNGGYIGAAATDTMVFSSSGGAERMRIDSGGNVIIGKTSLDFTVAGAYFSNNELVVTRNAAVPLSVNRLTDDGTLVQFFQANVLEGSISVSGTTVSYNGGHLSRWSQLYNETTQVEVYRGTVLESVDAMCEWYDEEGNLLSNEQATKTIVSTTPASKAVAGVFDRYDEDDEDNPYDFYVAQSGDFVIRVAAGTVVQNGDLLESAGDGTARVQADDICRSSTIAKVTSNYVSETYADGSFCVPCILMIG